MSFDSKIIQNLWNGRSAMAGPAMFYDFSNPRDVNVIRLRNHSKSLGWTKRNGMDGDSLESME